MSTPHPDPVVNALNAITEQLLINNQIAAVSAAELKKTRLTLESIKSDLDGIDELANISSSLSEMDLCLTNVATELSKLEPYKTPRTHLHI